MHSFKKHFGFKIITLVVAVLFLVPTAVKFAHIFTHHSHQVCNDYETTHIHIVDLDCEFFKFKVNKNFTYSLFVTNLFIEQTEWAYTVSKYVFLSEYQDLQTTLRGPPSLI